MVKLTISGTTAKVYDFIKNRFILLLAEQKLHYQTRLTKLQFTKGSSLKTLTIPYCSLKRTRIELLC